MSTEENEQPFVTAGEKMDDDFRIWRDRKLADPAFRRWASASPFTRPIATRSAKKLFDLTAGFVYSQILKACVELDLFAKLSGGPQTAEEVAAATDLTPDAAGRLLDAAVGLELVELRRDGRYGLGVLGAALHGEPGVRAMIAHHDMLYADLADPVALLKGQTKTRLSTFWPYAGAGADATDRHAADAGQGDAPEQGAASHEGQGQEGQRHEGKSQEGQAQGQAAEGHGQRRGAEGQGQEGEGLSDAAVADYSALMNESQSFVAEDVLDRFSFGDRNALLDVGGGEGAFAAAAAKRWPELRIGLVDIPAVAARASARLAQDGLSERVAVHAGDMFADPLPAGYDVISLVRVLHDHDDARVLALLRNVHDALEPQGELMIAEPIAGMSGARRVGASYFGFYLLAMGSGRPRDAAQLGELLRASGFANMRTRLTRGALPLAVITARRAGEGPIWRI